MLVFLLIIALKVNAFTLILFTLLFRHLISLISPSSCNPSLFPLYKQGEVGDLVVGRVAAVEAKRWKVNIQSSKDAVLQLSSGTLLHLFICFPHGIHSAYVINYCSQSAGWISAYSHSRGRAPDALNLPRRRPRLRRNTGPLSSSFSSFFLSHFNSSSFFCLPLDE